MFVTHIFRLRGVNHTFGGKRPLIKCHTAAEKFGGDVRRGRRRESSPQFGESNKVGDRERRDSA